MAIAFNTGTTGHAETASSVAITIPAGVLTNDVMILSLEVFCETGTTPTIAFSGGGGSWTAVPMNTGTNPEVATAGSSIWSYGFAYYRVATAGDPGATLTISESGSAAATTWFAVALAAYTGANTSSPIDVAFGSNAQGTSSGTAPSGNTATTGDWALHLAAVGINAAPLAGPGTSRENVVSSATVGAAIDDSNGSVGASGTSIGGGTWTQAGNTSDWWSLFTIGLKPPGAATPPPLPLGTTVRGRRARKGTAQGSPRPLLHIEEVAQPLGTAVRGRRARKGTVAGSPPPLLHIEEQLPATGQAVRGRRARRGLSQGSARPLVPPPTPTVQPPAATGRAVTGRKARRGAVAGSPPPLVHVEEVTQPLGTAVKGRTARRGSTQGSKLVAVSTRPILALGQLVRGRTARRGRVAGSPYINVKTASVVQAQQGTVSITATLAATCTIKATLAGTCTIAPSLAGKVTIGASLAGTATIHATLAGTVTIASEL